MAVGGLFLEGRITNDSRYYASHVWILRKGKAETAHFERKMISLAPEKRIAYTAAVHFRMTLKYAGFYKETPTAIAAGPTKR
jgi:hypothetical protein